MAHPVALSNQGDGIVASMGPAGGGAPGISGLLEEICVALEGAANTTVGTLTPEPPEQPAQPASISNATISRTGREACTGIVISRSHSGGVTDRPGDSHHAH